MASFHSFLWPSNSLFWDSLVFQTIKNLPECRRPGFNPWIGKIPWSRAWQPTPVFLPGEPSWTEKPHRLHSMGSQRVGHDWVTKHCNSLFYVYMPHLLHLCLCWWTFRLLPFPGNLCILTCSAGDSEARSSLRSTSLETKADVWTDPWGNTTETLFFLQLSP